MKQSVEKSPGALFADALIFTSVVKENRTSPDDPLFQQLFASVDWQVNSCTLAHLLLGVFQRWANDIDEDADTLFQDFATEIALATAPAI